MRKYPKDQRRLESTQWGGFGSGGGELFKLTHIVSDRETGDVTITVGKSRVVMSGRAALTLARVIGEHADHLGPAVNFMVTDRVEDVP